MAFRGLFVAACMHASRPANLHPYRQLRGAITSGVPRNTSFRLAASHAVLAARDDTVQGRPKTDRPIVVRDCDHRDVRKVPSGNTCMPKFSLSMTRRGMAEKKGTTI